MAFDRQPLEALLSSPFFPEPRLSTLGRTPDPADLFRPFTQSVAGTILQGCPGYRNSAGKLFANPGLGSVIALICEVVQTRPAPTQKIG
jgi:hypothetical protein